jgi:hypothetical protein
LLYRFLDGEMAGVEVMIPQMNLLLSFYALPCLGRCLSTINQVEQGKKP